MPISTLWHKVIGEKRQWRQCKARIRLLPESYQIAAEALLRYLMYFGSGTGGAALFEDLVDLLEQGAANRTPIREIVGDDPVEFIELFVRNYPKDAWVTRERERLTTAIDRAAALAP